MFPGLDMYVALRVPPALKATVSPFDLAWPVVKFTVDVVGFETATDPT